MKFTIIQDYKASDNAKKRRIKRQINNYLLHHISKQSMLIYMSNELGYECTTKNLNILMFFLGKSDLQGNYVNEITPKQKAANKLIIQIVEKGSDLDTFKDEVSHRSYSYFYEKYGFSKYNMRQLAEGYGIRKPSHDKYNYHNVMQTLNDKYNVDKDTIYDYYINQRISVRKLTTKLSRILGYNISDTVTRNILKTYNINTSDRKQ